MASRKGPAMIDRLIREVASERYAQDDGMNFGLGTVDYRDLAPVTEQLVTSYAQIATLGLPPKAVALAMLGATVNLFEAFGLAGQLPELLRATADMVEFEGQPS